MGKQVAEYYQDLAYKKCSAQPDLKPLIEELKSKGQHDQITDAIKAARQKHPVISDKAICHLMGQDMEDYLYDMKIVGKYAASNRITIAQIITETLGLKIGDNFDTVHNYIDDNNILRKGAIAANTGKRCVIPLNMRDGTLLCVGKGNKDWNWSAPHGAGRIMSRRQAKDTINMQEFEDSMLGIYTTSVNKNTIDEAPQAYKPPEAIVDTISDTVEIVDHMFPIYNFKSGGE